MNDLNQFAVFDMETHFSYRRAKMVEYLPTMPRESDARKVLGKSYKKEETILKHLPERLRIMRKDYESKIKKHKVTPQLNNIKIVTIKTNEPKVYIWENEYDDPDKERQIIEEVADLLLRTEEIITYNGSKFDFPILLYRGLALKAKCNYRELLKGMSQYGKFNIDLCRYFTKSLDYNLKSIYGKGKRDIDFDTCSFRELKTYAIEEINLLYRLGADILGYDSTAIF
jgi:DNA polymerase elongation subunit (family B)